VAVAGVARLKGREPGKPFLLIIADPKMAEDLGLLFNASARMLARAFWPGPLTLALPGGPRLPAMLRGPEGGIAVRHTGHAGLAKLVAAYGEPITSTSANRPGRPPAPGAEAVGEEFAPEIAAGELLVLDGGVLGRVPPSTLVDCTHEEPRLVREGAIPREELRRLVGRFAP
ncbi:MAG: L-threonylcarbamoyladenylate synthase, partial [Gemmatimonadetes bacterium]|nr:L-threonylcarbamoyladenylate synthase [Gemmatimonadota bacterium]